MKAAQINGYGGKEAVKVIDSAEKPRPAADQVLVEVRAAGVNPFDWKVREGKVKDFIKHEFPLTLGGDVSGVVAEIGDNVSGFEIGQEVYGQANAAGGEGSFAEFTPVKASQLASRPNSLDFIHAAALPVAAVSAYQALVDHINLRPGQKILIHGGAGGIGSFAIQIAKHLGAYVATTVSGYAIDFVKKLGADQTIDYKTQDFSLVIKDYDAVFDTVGGEANNKSYEVLKRGGILVSMTTPSAENKVTSAGINYVQQGTKTTAERLTKIAKLVDQGVLKANIDKVFPLQEAGDALEYLKISRPRGKVVIKIAD